MPNHKRQIKSCSLLYAGSAPAEVPDLRNKVGKNKRCLFSVALFLRADKQKENEKLRESLSRKTANLEHLQREFACVRGENERLQRELDEKEAQNRRQLQEISHGRSELSR